MRLVKEGRVNYMVEANYEEDSAIEQIMKKILHLLQIKEDLRLLEGERND